MSSESALLYRFDTYGSKTPLPFLIIQQQPIGTYPLIHATLSGMIPILMHTGGKETCNFPWLTRQEHVDIVFMHLFMMKK